MSKLTLDTDLVIESLLGRNTNAEIVDKVREKLRRIVLPWRKDGCLPPKYERVLADGRRVGLVDSFLGGYGNAHRPRFHGWGFKGNNPCGQGACISGIEKAELLGGHPDEDDMTEAQWKEAEEAALSRAKGEVDAFLRREFPDLVLL